MNIDFREALALVPATADWTDEQWEEHDRKVAASREASNRVDVARMQAEERAQYERNGFPARAIDASKAADPEACAIVAISEWSKSEDSILVLSGQPGCGKTVAATWWAWRCGFVPLFLRATEFAASSRYDHEKRDSWINANGLVLDDLGSEYADPKGSFLVDLDEMIDRYYGDRKPMVITTNSNAAQFKQRYGARIADRIRECGRFQSLAGVSLRKRSV